MLAVLVSAKGSPGVTTTALALGAAGVTGSGSPNGVLVLEADQAGGDLECWCGPLGEPGLFGAVTSVGGRGTQDRLWGHAVEAVPGLRSIVAPTTPAAVGAALHAAPEAFPEVVASLDGMVLVDLGRWVAPAPTVVSGLVRCADLAVVVCRSALASVEHTRALVATVSELNRNVVVAIVGGENPYSAEEVSLAVGCRVAGVLPWDRRGVATLVERGVGRPWGRSTLASAATAIIEGFGYLAGAHRVDGAHG